MTTPPGDESSEATTPSSDATAPLPEAPSSPPSSPPPQPPSPPPPAAPGQPYAFAPVPRPPRVPWVNPARRGHVVATSILAGLVLLLAGVGIGWAVTPTHRGPHPGRFARLLPALYHARYFPGGILQLPGRRIYFPPYPSNLPGPSATATTVPTPSASRS